MEADELMEYVLEDYVNDLKVDESESDSRFASSAGHRFFALKRQLFAFDLYKDRLAQIAKDGLKVLDIGCGNGRLVDYLVEHGIDAEGIAQTAPEGPRFMRQNITAVSPQKGCIPRADKTYDLVVIHSICDLLAEFSDIDASIQYATAHMNDPLLNVEKIKNYMKGKSFNAYFIMFEALRVLKQGGRLEVYPKLEKIGEKMEVELSKGFRVHQVFSPWGSLDDSLRASVGMNSPDSRLYTHKTVIHRL